MPTRSCHRLSCSRLASALLTCTAFAGPAGASVTVVSVHRELGAYTRTWPITVSDVRSSSDVGSLTLTAEAIGFHEPWSIPLTNRIVSTSIADSSGLRGTTSIDFHAYGGPSPSIPGGVTLHHRMDFTVDAPTPFEMAIDVTGNLENLFEQVMPIGVGIVDSNNTTIASVFPPSWNGPTRFSGVMTPGAYRVIYSIEAIADYDQGHGQFAGNVHYSVVIPEPGSVAVLLGGGVLGARRRPRSVR